MKASSTENDAVKGEKGAAACRSRNPRTVLLSRGFQILMKLVSVRAKRPPSNHLGDVNLTSPISPNLRPRSPLMRAVLDGFLRQDDLVLVGLCHQDYIVFHNSLIL